MMGGRFQGGSSSGQSSTGGTSPNNPNNPNPGGPGGSGVEGVGAETDKKKKGKDRVPYNSERGTEEHRAEKNKRRREYHANRPKERVEKDRAHHKAYDKFQSDNLSIADKQRIRDERFERETREIIAIEKAELDKIAMEKAELVKIAMEKAELAKIALEKAELAKIAMEKEFAKSISTPAKTGVASEETVSASTFKEIKGTFFSDGNPYMGYGNPDEYYSDDNIVSRLPSPKR